MKGPRTSRHDRIGKVIRERRAAQKWTQEGFADHIEMHRAQYGFLEQGRWDLRLSTLERVARGLDDPIWCLLRESESP